MSQEITLDLFLSHLRNAVAIARPDGTFLFKNTVFDIYFMRGRSESHLFDLFKENSLILDVVKKVTDVRGSYFLRDVPVRLTDETHRNMDVEAFPLVGFNGDLLAINLIFHDRTGSAQFEEHQKVHSLINFQGLPNSSLP